MCVACSICVVHVDRVAMRDETLTEPFADHEFAVQRLRTCRSSSGSCEVNDGQYHMHGMNDER